MLVESYNYPMEKHMAHRSLAARAAPLLIALIPFSAWSAGTATIQAGGESNSMSWLDNSTVRFDMPAANGSYMVSRDGKTYMVNPKAAGGMPPVMEVGGMIQGFANMAKGSNASPLAMDIKSVKATGQTQTVAGIKGEVYQITTIDNKGQSKTMEAVFTNDPLVVEMTTAYLAFSEPMIGAQNAAKFKNALPKGKQGLLRVGDDMVVQSISNKKPSASTFELPAQPTNMNEMMKGLMKQLQQK